MCRWTHRRGKEGSSREDENWRIRLESNPVEVVLFEDGIKPSRVDACWTLPSVKIVIWFGGYRDVSRLVPREEWSCTQYYSITPNWEELRRVGFESTSLIVRRISTSLRGARTEESRATFICMWTVIARLPPRKNWRGVRVVGWRRRARGWDSRMRLGSEESQVSMLANDIN